MTRLFVSPHSRIAGYYLIRYGQKIVASVCQPNFAVDLGIALTADDVRSAVREVAPHVPATAPVVFR